MKRFLFCAMFFAVFFAAAPVFATPVISSETEQLLHSFLSKENAAVLMETGTLMLSRYNSEDMTPVLVPPFPVAKHCAAAWNKEKPSYSMEMLYLYKKEHSEKDVKKISQILRSVSKLEGLEYYSSSRKKMRTLYQKSYMIDDPKTKNMLDDPLDTTEMDFSAYVLQQDPSFGENIYHCRFLSDGDSSGFMSLNTGTLKYSIFKAVSPENLLISVTVTDMGDVLLVHCITRARFASLGMFKNRIQNSFHTRVEAVYNWFIRQYEADTVQAHSESAE